MPNEGVPMWAFSAVLILFNGLLGMMIMRLWKSVDGNTSAVNGLSIDLPKTYATKLDAERHRDDDLRGFAEQRASLHAIELRMTAIDGEVKVAQAGLRSP